MRRIEENEKQFHQFVYEVYKWGDENFGKECDHFYFAP